MEDSLNRCPYVDNYSTELPHVAVVMPAVLVPVVLRVTFVLRSQKDFAFVAAVARPGTGPFRCLQASA